MDWSRIRKAITRDYDYHRIVYIAPIVSLIFVWSMTAKDAPLPFVMTYTLGETLFEESPDRDCQTIKKFRFWGRDYFYESLTVSETEKIHFFSGWADLYFYNPAQSIFACKKLQEAHEAKDTFH